MIPKATYQSFFNAIYSVISNKEKSNKTSVEKLAANFGISDKNTIKEITETAIVTIARKIANQPSKSVKQKYDEIVDLYKSQVNLSHRTSQSMLLQQYSTPATIGYLMGVFCKIDQVGNYYEPSSGNGMLTIANTGKDFTVNEIDGIRCQNLKFQNVYKWIGQNDSSKETYRSKYFDAIITNPPFSTLNKDENLILGEYEIKHLDHKMAILALNSMKDNGKAAIIVGGHTSWDDKGRIQAGKNRIFLSYLYKNYNVDDIILIDGNALYSKMGTGFDTRIILINGRKPKAEGFAPLKNDVLAQVITTTDDLYSRFSKHFENKENQKLSSEDFRNQMNKIIDSKLKNIANEKPKNITVPVLRYKANGNDLIDTKKSIDAIEGIENAFTIKENGGGYYLVLKLTNNNKVIYFEEGSYSERSINEDISQILVDKLIQRIENNLLDTTTVRHISKLSLEVAEKIDYDYKKLQQIRDAFYIQKRENEVAQQKQKEQQKVDYAKKEIQNASEKFRLFAFGDAGIDYDTIEILIKENNLEKPHIRTIGSLRKRNVVFKNQGKSYTYNNWQSKAKSKYKIHTNDAIFIIIEKLKEIYKNSTPNKGKALRLRAKAVSIKQKQLLELGNSI